ncbi:translation initiation factor IF-3 [Candidatus Curtissbacteria bacterium]|nr:translation initiation factor IF-3 [Candidatus Curtissbacteria bacterium]
MRVIGEDGTLHGVLSREEALKKAQEFEVDLIEIAPEAKPPVVKLIDYKKFQYLEDKKEREARKKAKQTELKEVRFTPFIGEHDLQTNLRKVKEFLAGGDIVKVSIVFKGRQMTHQEFGPKLLDKIKQELNNQVVEERPARMEGRRYVTVIRGVKGAFQKEEKNHKSEETKETKKQKPAEEKFAQPNNEAENEKSSE